MATGSILTTIGRTKLNSATPLQQLNISHVAVGDGNGGFPALNQSMTALVNEVWRGNASSPIRDPNNAGTIVFESVIPADVGGFTVREIGLFDIDGDLIAIGHSAEIEKPAPVNQAVSVLMTARIFVALDTAAQINLILQQDPYVNADNVDWNTYGTSAKKISNSISNIFKPENYYTVDNPSVEQQTSAIMQAIIDASGGGKVVASGVYNVNPMFFDNNDVYDVTIDFSGSTVNCVGARTRGTTFDWEYGVFSFHGQRAGVEQVVTFSANQIARTANWQVNDSSQFSVGDYWELEIDPDNDTDVTGDFSTKLVWRLLRVARIVNATTIAFDYQRIFDIPAGTKVIYRKINPVKNVVIKNLNNLVYMLPYAGTNQNKLEASSGVTFLYAANCEVDGLEYKRNPKQSVHFELTNGCKSKRVELFSLIEFNSGGYAVQFEKSIHFEVDSCKSSRDRHLFDATASSHGLVKNCDGSETSNSTFTTHGTYEHDIVYSRNKGHFQLAGSGVDYGQTACNITVRDHVGTVYKGDAPNIYDISIYDSTFNSTMDANLDGLFLQNVTTKNNCRFKTGSSKSKRKNIAINCSLDVGSNFMNAEGKELILIGGKILEPRNNNDVFVAGQLITNETDWVSSSTATTPVTVQMEKLHIKGGEVSGVPFIFAGTANQSIIIAPNVINKGNRASLSLARLQKTGGEINLKYKPIKSENTDRHLTAIDTENSALTNISIESTEFYGGSIRVDAGALNGGYLSRLNPKYYGTTVQYPTPSAVTYSIGEQPTLYGQINYSLTLVAGDSTSVNVDVPGCFLGDSVDMISFNVNLTGVRMLAQVTAANTVTVYFLNESGSTVNTGSGVIRVMCGRFI